MSYMVRVYADVCWVGEGMGGAGLGILAANNPGYGSGSGLNIAQAGTMPNGQTIRFQQGEQVLPATFNVPTAAEISVAIESAAEDIEAQITAAVLAQIQAWATGGP
jgi:hypothetical protein